VTPNGDNSYEVIKYAYDFYGDITSYTDGDGNTENYQYNDLTGQLTVKILRNLDTITYTYDNAGNILKIIGTQSDKTTLTNTYTYDLAGSLLEAINASCDTKYTYDDAGRMTKETDVYTGGGSYEKDYTYDGSNIKTITIKRNNVTQNVFTYGFDSSTGRLATIDYNSLYSLSYGYDKNGNVTNKSVTNDNASQTATSSSYTYYPSNLVSTYI
jgi:YD repeat-containing protein